MMDMKSEVHSKQFFTKDEVTDSGEEVETAPE